MSRSAMSSNEALAFGWVDSRPRTLDDERSARLITPRAAASNWSRVNKRVERLTEQGRMAPAGLAAVRTAKANGRWSALDAVEDLKEPEDLRDALDADDTARRFWGSGDEHFAPTTVDDTARYAARAALDPDVEPGKFAVAGDSVSFNEIIAAHERATGRRYEPRSRGDVAELRAWIDARDQEGDHGSALMGRYVEYMLSGQTQLEDVQNDRYRDIEPQTLEDLQPAPQG